MDIAKEIRILLAQEDLKVSELARLMNTSHQNITNVLNRNNPTLKIIMEIANAIGYDTNISFTKKS